MESLPNEKLLQIAKEMDITELYNMCQINKAYSEICKSDYFWKEYYNYRVPTKYKKDTITLDYMKKFGLRKLTLWQMTDTLEHLLAESKTEKGYPVGGVLLTFNDMTTIKCSKIGNNPLLCTGPGFKEMPINWLEFWEKFIFETPKLNNLFKLWTFEITNNGKARPLTLFPLKLNN